jgi:3-hydroxyisobutyrate dehydrogenase
MQIPKREITIGFIGTGVMGRHMAGHLLRAGYPLIIHNRTKEKALPLLAMGADWAEKVPDLATRCQVIFTIIGTPKDVQEIYLGKDGLVSMARPGTCLVDMTTSSPKLAAQVFEAAKARAISALDAPVTGGETGAKNATLTILVGGDAKVFESVLPILQLMGSNVMHQGPAGAGQHTKLCNQIAMSATMMGVCEALSYARHSGVDPTRIFRCLEIGSASSFTLKSAGPRMLAGDYSAGFYVKHLIKDLRIAQEIAEEMGLRTHALGLAIELYEQLAAAGEEYSGTQALFKLYLP